MPKPVINVADSASHSEEHGERFGYSMTELAEPLGARAIGANLTRVPPGRAAFPFHHHHRNEEHFFVLGGTGVLRFGDETYAIKPHDYIVNLPGGPEVAHQIVNTGSEELVYLAISTNDVPDVVGFPDSGKTAVRTSWSADETARFTVAEGARETASRWEGEDGGRVAEIVKRGGDG
jgi:uncharacterized cupin superfamily protein